MARATRSSANLDQANKKRKRNPSPQERPQKLLRSSDHSISLADSSLQLDDAHKILQVLESSDSLGLLDRVFPLSPSSDISFSFRTLLSQPQQHSLRVLRAAVQHLYPLSSHPRSKHSETASQQLHFCNLALSLLDQASRNSLSIPLDTPSLFPPDPSDSLVDDYKPSLSPPSPSLAKHRYALVQHLPSGDYWSSLNSECPTSPSPQFKDLSTGYAELVSILPTSSASQSSKPPTLLGSYSTTKSFKKVLPAQRRVTTCAFLNYGPWASFAPSFDHDSEIVGRRQLGEVLWYKHERKSQKEVELREWIEGRGSVMAIEENKGEKLEGASIDIEAEFDGLLPPEDIQNLKAAFDNAELEKLVDELLTRNQRALVRLQELQIDRLTKEGSESLTLDEASEECEIAHGIMESLETLTSLRPRAANGNIVSIVPPASILRKLHSTLALEPRPGWYGTLVPTRATALRDDSTVKVRPSSTVPVAASTSSSPAPTSITPVAPTAAPTTTPYSGYTYAYSAQQQAQSAYRPATAAAGTTTYTPYKPGATSYYQNYIQGAQQQQQQYYGQQAYGTGATSQQPYAAYSSWFAHAQYSQAAAAAGTASTGRGTPQPAAAAAYNTFYPQQSLPAQQQRTTNTAGVTTPAVANTAAMNKVGTGTGAATGAWVGFTGQHQQQPQGVVPTLPTHLRPTQVVANGYQSQQQQSYYGTYQTQQPQQPAAR